MKFYILALLLITVVGFDLGSASESNALSRQKRQTEIFENTRKLIEQLATNLRAAGEKAIESIREFTSGIQNQVSLFQQKVIENVNKLKERVGQAIKDITDRFQSSGSKVKECVDGYRNKADALFRDTVSKSMACADDRINEIKNNIEGVTAVARSAMEVAEEALLEARNCTSDENGNFFSVGTCLSSVAIQTEMKGAAFLTSSGLSVARINLQLAILPAALEVCAGSRLVEAGMGTGKIALEIGSCSASSLLSVFNIVNNSSS